MEVSKIMLDNQLSRLLRKDFSQMTALELQEYIFKLKKHVYSLKLRNDFLLKEESYIPIECPVNYPYNREKMLITDIELPDRDWLAITVTFDQQKHPQLILTPSYEQKKYIEKVFSNLLYEQHITAVYGCFERHKSGYIHSHVIIPHYGDYTNLYNKLVSYFTNRSPLKQHAILIKPVNDLSKWINYINKEAEPFEFYEFNLRKNTIEI